jgi:hypothetical protein
MNEIHPKNANKSNPIILKKKNKEDDKHKKIFTSP